jgi:AraC-like DNA-binding protein
MSATVKGYEELAPPASLADAVDAFWRFTVTSSAPRHHRVLPDGCTDLIFHFRNVGGRAWLAAPELVAVGPMERFALVDLEPGAVSVGVRLKPGWALPVLGVSPRELCGLSVPVADCAPRLAGLQRRLEDCRSPDGLLSLLQRTVVERLASVPHKPRAAEALRWLQASGGQVRLSTLARELGHSERTLHRQVLDEAGVPPKLLARVLRFQRALPLLRSGAAPSAVALDCGYSDQAHLTREVREFAGVTPTALSDFFKTAEGAP